MSVIGYLNLAVRYGLA